jgi:hypothetical protein
MVLIDDLVLLDGQHVKEFKEKTELAQYIMHVMAKHPKWDVSFQPFVPLKTIDLRQRTIKANAITSSKSVTTGSESAGISEEC